MCYPSPPARDPISINPATAWVAATRSFSSTVTPLMVTTGRRGRLGIWLTVTSAMSNVGNAAQFHTQRATDAAATCTGIAWSNAMARG